ncbi:hypothetical protein ACFLVZ_01520 [Chloroflexota bacterium]
MVKKYQINIVPILLFVQGRRYRDMPCITQSEACELSMQDLDSFHSSPSPPAEYRKAYYCFISHSQFFFHTI